MTRRTLYSAGRLIVSVAGVEVAPNLPEEQKVFDSDRFFSGRLILSGFYFDPSAPNSSGANTTDSAADYVIPLPYAFDQQSYCLFRAVAPASYNGPTDMEVPIFGANGYAFLNVSEMRFKRAKRPEADRSDYVRAHYAYWIFGQ
ncbi:hypothetical protein [Aureimonas leprariae]|uniref:Uncharacterized protein n=1 Tax=Plantimonas leprariae TaxID=2615207 RepID=A0A7V7TXR4_9HYPH|nr:hypothetical protein [Aureimonas leprariae]KAB0682014.1 hypothetical protein F6X38_04195 [Aureimonas leprariae]